jgi:protein TonB
VYLWVDEKGNPSHVRVVHGIGMGLDEKAIEAVRQYKFTPATVNGKPVKVDMYIEVRFGMQDR